MTNLLLKWIKLTQVNRIKDFQLYNWATLLSARSGARSGAISAIKRPYTMYMKTGNAMFRMTCNVCKTSMALNKRMNLHRSECNTRKFNRSPVAHFKWGAPLLWQHRTLLHRGQQYVDRKNRETYWVRGLKTLHPHGINKTFTWIFNKIITLPAPVYFTSGNSNYRLTLSTWIGNCVWTIVVPSREAHLSKTVHTWSNSVAHKPVCCQKVSKG